MIWARSTTRSSWRFLYRIFKVAIISASSGCNFHVELQKKNIISTCDKNGSVPMLPWSLLLSMRSHTFRICFDTTRWLKMESYSANSAYFIKPSWSQCILNWFVCRTLASKASEWRRCRDEKERKLATSVGIARSKKSKPVLLRLATRHCTVTNSFIGSHLVKHSVLLTIVYLPHFVVASFYNNLWDLRS